MHAPPLAKWDSYWYHRIAVEGYSFDAKDLENSVGFYPAYPLLVRAASAVLRTPPLWPGIVLSLLFLAGALLAIGELVAGQAGERVAIPGVAALLLFPTSFFFAAFYTESLFLLASGGAFWAAAKKRWLLAGLCGGAASLARFNGFLLALPLAWYIWEERRAGNRAWGSNAAKAFLPLLAGAVAYPIYLGRRFGDPLLYLRSKSIGWGKSAAPPWVSLINVGKGLFGWARGQAPEYALNFVLETGSAILFVWLVVLLFRRRRIAEGFYTGGTLLLLFCSANLDGLPRFVLVLFPCFLPIGEALARRSLLALAYAVAGIGLGTLLLYRFVHWIIVA